MGARPKVLARAVSAVALGLVATEAARGQVYSWNTPNNGTWSTGANWSPVGGPPDAAGESASFAQNSTYTVTFSVNPASFGILSITKGNVTFNLNSFTLTTTSPTNTGMGTAGESCVLTLKNGTFNPGVIDVGDSGGNATLSTEGVVTINAGPGGFVVGSGSSTGTAKIQGFATLNSSGTSAIGLNAASVGTAIVNGSSASWNAASTLVVGYDGNGTLQILNGGTVTATALEVGQFLNSVGNISMSGAGSSFTTSGTANIGGQFTTGPALSATLGIGAGATMNLNGTTNLRSVATVNVTGGTLNLNTLNFSAGAVVNFSSGKINFASGSAITPDILNLLLASTNTLGTGRTLSATAGTLSLTSPLSVNGGKLSAADLSLNANVSIGAFGTISGTNVTIESGKGVEIADFGTLTSPNPIFNNGLLQVEGPLANVTGFTFNLGIVQGTGRFSAGMNNSTLGSIRAREGDYLIIEQNGNTNNGRIELSGGTVEYTKILSNLGGASISGHGTFRGNTSTPGAVGLSNSGLVQLSGGYSEFRGDVQNNSSGKFIVSGNSLTTFYDDVSNLGTGEFRVSTGSTAVFFGFVTNTGTFSGGGTKLFEAGSSGAMGALSTTGSTIVEDGAAVQATFFRESALTVLGDATVNVNGASGGLSVLSTLTVGASGNFDLKDNDLVVNNGNYTTIKALVAQGFLNTTGITSSTSNGRQILALFDNALVGKTSWLGQPIGSDAVVGKYTYIGDMNLDGQVTGDDYTVVDSHLNSVPTVGLEWLSGDANRDGLITGDDYTVIDSTLGLGVTIGDPLSPSAIPEPAGLAIAALAGLPVIRRRRTRPAI